MEAGAAEGGAARLRAGAAGGRGGSGPAVRAERGPRNGRAPGPAAAAPGKQPCPSKSAKGRVGFLFSPRGTVEQG